VRNTLRRRQRLRPGVEWGERTKDSAVTVISRSPEQVSSEPCILLATRSRSPRLCRGPPKPDFYEVSFATEREFRLWRANTYRSPRAAAHSRSLLKQWAPEGQRKQSAYSLHSERLVIKCLVKPPEITAAHRHSLLRTHRRYSKRAYCPASLHSGNAECSFPLREHRRRSRQPRTR